MKDLKTDLIDTQRQNDELRNMVESLSEQVVSLGGKLCPFILPKVINSLNEK